jgi:hypothetical protein
MNVEWKADDVLFSKENRKCAMIINPKLSQIFAISFKMQPHNMMLCLCSLGYVIRRHLRQAKPKF